MLCELLPVGRQRGLPSGDGLCCERTSKDGPECFFGQGVRVRGELPLRRECLPSLYWLGHPLGWGRKGGRFESLLLVCFSGFRGEHLHSMAYKLFGQP